MTVQFSDLNLNLCPVCGYRLRRQPIDSDICWCCGTQFGYNDSGRSYEELRDSWIRCGMPWESPVHAMPAGWNPMGQLIAAGYIKFEDQKPIVEASPVIFWDNVPHWAFSTVG